MTEYKMEAYLAGPDVFYPGAKQIGEQKKAFLATLGINGHFPFDNEIPKEAMTNPDDASRAIGDANEDMMYNCCGDGKIGIILVNMNPYHGPSMDCGTAFEGGFMSALAKMKKNVIIVGYTDDPRPFEQRVIEDYYKGNVTHRDGMIFGSDGNMIEAFGGADNLMITNAIHKTGGKVCKTFEEAATLAKELAEAKIKSLTTGPERFIRTDKESVISLA